MHANAKNKKTLLDFKLEKSLKSSEVHFLRRDPEENMYQHPQSYINPGVKSSW
jgi:hypothetical protein